MEIDHTEGTKGNIIALETNYNNLLSRVNVLGETSFYYLGLIPELENEIHNISMHIRSIERYQNEIKGGITVKDKLSMLPDNIQKLITKKPLVEFVIDPVLMEIQKDTMRSLISEYQRLVIYLKKKVTVFKYRQQSKENNIEPLIAKQIQKTNYDFITGIDINLLKYLSENFISTDKRFNDLTKYNHIYRFLNEGRERNIEHRAYKNLIKKTFSFNYENREIKGQTGKHLEQLENLALNYNNSKK